MDMINFLEALAKDANYRNKASELIAHQSDTIYQCYMHNDAQLLKKQISIKEHYPDCSSVVREL